MQRVQDLEKGVPHPTSIEELRRAVKLHEQRLERLHAVQDQVGVWYKMLALRYFDRKMYTHALDAFTQAITFAPENKHLFFTRRCVPHMRLSTSLLLILRRKCSSKLLIAR